MSRSSQQFEGRNWIRTRREELGWSTYELARRAGVAQPSVINWERRERDGSITLATLQKAAVALGCTVDYRLSASPRTSATATPKQKANRPAAASYDPNEIWS
jgi:transcriptional regulator with XRE-family HTH domain